MPVAPDSAGTSLAGPHGWAPPASSKHSAGVSVPFGVRAKCTTLPGLRDAAYTSLPSGLTATGRVPELSAGTALLAPQAAPAGSKHWRKLRLPVVAAPATPELANP